MSMRKVTFHYDDALVCGNCGHNDALHYNAVIFAHNGRILDDPDCAYYCDGCGALDGPLTTVEELEAIRLEEGEEED